MIDIDKIRQIAEERLQGTDLFLIDIKCSHSNEIDITIDSDTRVDIESCVILSKGIEEQLDREAEDFELTVSSAGVGQPLKLYRQYKKLIGGDVEVVLRNGTKIIAELTDASEDSITLTYEEMRAEEGSKRKRRVEIVETYPLEEVKTTKEYIDFR